jgi:hypothetical protein
MRPRLVFALLLALGAALHLILVIRPTGSLSYLAHYLGWLLPSLGVVVVLWVGSASGQRRSAQARQARSAPPGGWREGLALFAAIAALGLLIHLIGPSGTGLGWNPSFAPRRTGWNQTSAMVMMAVLCAAGSWGLLRGAPGDAAAPLPGGSRVVKAGGWLRRAAGFALAGGGAWLLVTGLRQWGHAGDGVDRLLNLAFVVGGPLWLVIGLVLALRGGRKAG